MSWPAASSEYLTERWLPGQVSQLSPATFDSYRRNIELHVVPRISGVPLQRLVAEDLDRLYAALSATGGRRDGKKGGLSPKSVRIVHAVLHKALSDARRKGTLARNVAEVADAPKVRSAVKRQEIKVWNPEELRMFLDLTADNRNHALGSSPPTPGCAAVKCSAFDGATSTSTSEGWRYARRRSSSRTSSWSQTSRPTPGDDPSTSTSARSPC